MRATILSLMVVSIILALRSAWRRVTVLSKGRRVAMHVLSCTSAFGIENDEGIHLPMLTMELLLLANPSSSVSIKR